MRRVWPLKRLRVFFILGGAALVACAAVLSAASPIRACGTKCGVYRWEVKTIAPATVPSPWAAATATVAQLNSVVRPSPNPGRNAGRTAPVETTMFTVAACLWGLTGQKDNDYHLMINDLVSHDETMIIEVPDIACSDACASPFSAQYTSTRKAIETASATHVAVQQLHAKLRALRATEGPGEHSALVLLTVPVQIQTQGAGFWDMRGHGKGHATNSMELHPIVDIAISKTACTKPSLTKIRQALAESDDD